MAIDIVKLRALQPPEGLGFKIRRLGHVVLQVTDLERSLLFYTQVLGFKVTEIYSEDLQPGGFAFLRCHTDHHSIALVGNGAALSQHKELHHVAFEVGSVEEVFAVRERLREQAATITFEGRRRAGCQIAVEFLDFDGHCLEIYWGLDQIGTSGHVRPASEWKGSGRWNPPSPTQWYARIRALRSSLTPRKEFFLQWNKRKTGARWESKSCPKASKSTASGTRRR